MELAANFILNNESLDAQFDISELENFDAIFELYAAGTTWGNISGTLSNQTDLQTALDLKANQSELDITNNTVSNLADTVTDNYNTLNNKIGANTQSITTINGTLATFGDIVTYDADDFATAAQGALADTALQPSDNISELYNDAGYITSSALSGYATESYVTEGLAAKQDTLTAGNNIQIVNNTISATDTTYSAGQGISIVNGTISNTQTSAEWGNITGTLSDQTDLQNALNAKYDASNPSGYTSNVGTVTSVNNVSPDSNGNVTISIPSSATWGNITGTLSDQTDLQNALNDKQNTLTAGNNITISNGTISATDTIYTLPSATTSTLGGIIVGNNLSIAADGTLSSTDTTYSQGDGIVISGGSISVSTTIASKTDIGTADITIKENGTAIGTINANATTASSIDISVPTTATEVGALPSSTIIGDGAVIFQKNGTALGTITANQTSTTTVNYTIPTTASDVGALPDTTTIGDGATTIQVNGTSVGTITANQTTSGSINISALQNTATGEDSLTIFGVSSDKKDTINIGRDSNAGGANTNIAIGNNSTISSNSGGLAIGASSKVGAFSLGATAIGTNASATGSNSTAIGRNATVNANNAMQIGYGTNSTAFTLAVGFNDTNYQLLDGTTGLIPDARLSSNIARTSVIPDISNLANKSLSNLDSTGQGVLDGKANTALTNLTNGLSNTICTVTPTTTSTASSVTPAVVIENYVNGTEWYRVWSDGWCEQGGYLEQPSATVGYITLLKPYPNTNYRILGFEYGTGGAVLGVYEGSQTASSFGLVNRASGVTYGFAANWYTQGYIS